MVLLVINQPEFRTRKILDAGFEIVLLGKNELYSQDLLNRVLYFFQYEKVKDIDYLNLQKLDLAFKYVFASNERDIPDAAFIGDKLQLPAPCSIQQLPFFYNKFEMRKQLDQVGIKNIKYFLETDIKNNKHIPLGKYIIKPLNGTGSENIRQIHIDSYHPVSLMDNELLEEFIEGVEYTLDFFIQQETIHLLGVTQTKQFKKSFIEKSHLAGAILPAQTINKIKEEISIICKKIKFKNGPLHVEILVNKDNHYYIEFHPRPGGGCIPQINKIVSGNDINTFFIKYLRNELVPEEKKPVKFAIVQFLTSLEEYNLLESQKNDLIEELGILNIQGSLPLCRGSDRFGYFIVSAVNRKEVDKKLIEVESIIAS